MVCFPKTFLLNLQIVYCSPNPRCITTSGLGSSYFARHYFRNRVFFLFLWVLRCFSSPRYLLIHYFTHVWVIRLLPLIEFPHSDIYGYNGYLLLPVAFRSLSRPSSALGAQAFTLRSLQLNLFRGWKLDVGCQIFAIYSKNQLYILTSNFLLLTSFWFIVNNYSMFNIASLFFWLIVFYYEYSSLPLFLLFSIYFSMCFPNLYIKLVWWAQMESASRVLKTIH